MDAFPALSLSPVDALRFKSTVLHAELRDKGERPILAEERLRQLYSIDGAGWSWPGCRKIRLVWLSDESPLESGGILGLLDPVDGHGGNILLREPGHWDHAISFLSLPSPGIAEGGGPTGMSIDIF